MSTEQIWLDGLTHELDFWDRWLATEGLEWPDEYRRRFDPNLRLSNYHQGFVEDLDKATIDILDVGAGPVTHVGKTHPGKSLNLIPVDALADEYNQLLSKYERCPPVPTLPCRSENLQTQFADSSFDLTLAQNCLDHTVDPLRSVAQMLAVTRPRGWVLLNHSENEADHENFEGLHQWNITLEDNDLIIRGQHHSVNVSQELASLGKFSCVRTAERYIRVHIRKY
ncbi:MAG: methyltransferase domain-containing protein [Cyanobacteria bacterium P01_H01_bin.15]